MSDIFMVVVDTSQIHAIGHNGKDTLAIQFKNKDGTPGAIYHYQNFSAEHFKRFRAAESINAYFYRHIKHNAQQYPYKKVTP